MERFDGISKPTMLLNAETTRRNIARMAQKARSAGIRFRPHFKTHQSAAIGEWFRAQGVTAITVSSLEMAEYFANAGWDDITVAFPVNVREMDTINRLAQRIELNLLVEAPETVGLLSRKLTTPVNIWIKVNAGANRTGLGWECTQDIVTLAQSVAAANSKLRFQGLLTHAGHTYDAVGKEAVTAVYAESIVRMQAARRAVQAAGLPCALSVGDTPATTLVDDLGAVEEIRPGNFVFYDTHQYLCQVCGAEDIAVAVACPVVARHPERDEIVIYGGAIHLSKDFVMDAGHRVYGLVSHPTADGWSAPIPGAYVNSLSQEHGILTVPRAAFGRFPVGSLAMILPAHSCLTVQVMKRYLTLDGEVIETLN
jgi:D-serine deaminase-like pyridoxal phosphate-dependent protein